MVIWTVLDMPWCVFISFNTKATALWYCHGTFFLYKNWKEEKHIFLMRFFNLALHSKTTNHNIRKRLVHDGYWNKSVIGILWVTEEKELESDTIPSTLMLTHTDAWYEKKSPLFIPKPSVQRENKEKGCIRKHWFAPLQWHSHRERQAESRSCGYETTRRLWWTQRVCSVKPANCSQSSGILARSIELAVPAFRLKLAHNSPL